MAVLSQKWWAAASLILLAVPGRMSAMGSLTSEFVAGMFFQESSSGAPLGRLVVAPEVMAGRCLTKVSPKYPMGAIEDAATSVVIVRVVVWQSGRVTPMKMVSGNPALEAEAMNVVRLWRYKPFVRDQTPMDVTTDVAVDFTAGKPAGMVTHPHV